MRQIEQLVRAVRKRLPARRTAYSFHQAADQFRKRLDVWAAEPKPPASKGRVAVLVTPWLDTPVPLFSVEIALALRAEGWQPVFICDFSQLAFNEVAPVLLTEIERMSCELSRFGERISVTQEASETPPPEDLDSLIRENAVWRTKGEELAETFLKGYANLHETYAAHFSRVRNVLVRAQADWLLLPGGVFGVSGLYLRAAKLLRLQFTTYDSGPGRFFAAHDGIAAHSSDLPVAHGLLSQELRGNPKRLATIRTIVDETVNDRQELRDPFKFQAVAPTGRTDFASDMLVCLNYRADTAALFRTRAFPNIREWVMAVLDYAERRGNLRVNIRPHPVTRQPHVRSTDQLGEAVLARDPEGRYSRWISADAPVSSYDLLNTTRVVLPFTSTVGIEAALLGKPVILGSRAYYESLGFVHAAANATAYFELIDQALNNEKPVTDSQREQAALTLYLMLKCRSVYTSFTPQPSDFVRWMQESPGQLWARPEMLDIRSALSTRQCLAWLRHQRLFAHAD